MRRQRIAMLTVLVVLVGSSVILQGCGLFGGCDKKEDNPAAKANEASSTVSVPAAPITVNRTIVVESEKSENSTLPTGGKITDGILETNGSLKNNVEKDAESINNQIDKTGKSTSF